MGTMAARKRANKHVKSESFAQVIADVKAAAAADELDGRSTNRFVGRDLWDEQGRHWTLIGPIDEAEAADMITRADVRLAIVWQGNRAIEWVPGTHRRRIWSDRISPGLGEIDESYDSSKGEMFAMQEWSRVGGARMVVAQKFC